MGLIYHLKDDPDRMIKVLSKLTGMEIYNSECIGSNGKAERFYFGNRLAFPWLGAFYSSDAHTLWESGSSHTILDMPEDYSGFRNSESVVDWLRSAISSSKTPKGKKGGVLVGSVGFANHVLGIFREEGDGSAVKGVPRFVKRYVLDK